MKKFIINIVIFSAIFFAVDKLWKLLIDAAPRKQADKRLELLVNGKINKDIIILGSSRGARDVIASDIQAETGKSAYNLSYPGSNVEFHEFLLKTVLKFNQHPKVVILTIDDPYELISNESIVFRLDRLYPLVKYDYIFQELINRKQKESMLLSKFLYVYRLNKVNLELKKKRFTKLDTILSDGSMPLSWQRKHSAIAFGESPAYSAKNETSPEVDAFKGIVKICNENNIKLVLLFPPNSVGPHKGFEDRIKELANNKAIPYSYDRSNAIYHNTNYYWDKSHLRTNGAKVFTNELSTFLKKSVL